MNLLHEWIWVTSQLLCASALVLGFWSKRIKDLPTFFLLLGWYCIVFVVMSSIYSQSAAVWSWVALVLTQATFLLEVAVVYELFRIFVVLRTSVAEMLKPMSKRVLAVLILLSALGTALTPEAAQPTIRLALQRLSVLQDVIEIGLLITLFAFTRILGISWKGLPTGVALGLGISASTDVIAMAAMSRVGRSVYLPADTLHMAGFLACVMIWLWYVLRAERSLTSGISQEVQIKSLLEGEVVPLGQVSEYRLPDQKLRFDKLAE